MKRVCEVIGWALAVVILAGVIAVICMPDARSFASFALWKLRGESGTLYLPRGDGSVEFQRYADGRRTGVWRVEDKAGNLLAESEYRNDEPWNGICYIYPMKAWLGEYRNGKPWRGCLPQYTTTTRSTDWLYFLDGREVNYDDYCKTWNLRGAGHQFAGLGYLGQFQENTE